MQSLVKDLMTTQVVTVGPATPFKEVVARLAEHRVSATPMVDGDGLVLGVVSDADIAREVRRHVLVRSMWIDRTSSGSRSAAALSPSRASWSAAA
jgi:CBS domain-containing protein